MMLANNKLRGQSDVTSNHLQAGVPQNLLEGEDVSSIHQIVGGEGVPAEMSM